MELVMEILRIILFFLAILYFGFGILLAVIGWSTIDERKSEPTIGDTAAELLIGLLMVIAWPILIWWYRKKY